MRFTVLVQVALVAIAATQNDTPSNSEMMTQIQDKCVKEVGYPCKNVKDTNAVDDCLNANGEYNNCQAKCNNKNKDNYKEAFKCYQSKCKSDNKDAQDYYEKYFGCLNSNSVSILAFTAIASVLALLF